MPLIGYVRISTTEGAQLPDRQLDALRDAGCEKVFEGSVRGRGMISAAEHHPSRSLR